VNQTYFHVTEEAEAPTDEDLRKVLRTLTPAHLAPSPNALSLRPRLRLP
jgi:hypothetical protein